MDHIKWVQPGTSHILWVICWLTMAHKLWLMLSEKIRIVQIQAISIFESNVEKGRIRHKTTSNLNVVIFNRFWVDLKIHPSDSEVQSRFYVGSDSFRHWFQKTKWLASGLPLFFSDSITTLKPMVFSSLLSPINKPDNKMK